MSYNHFESCMSMSCFSGRIYHCWLLDVTDYREEVEETAEKLILIIYKEKAGKIKGYKKKSQNKNGRKGLNGSREKQLNEEERRERVN